MSERAPNRLGGTASNSDKRFEIITKDQNNPSDLKSNSSEAENGMENRNDDEIPEITAMESLCMSCGENGVTKLLLTIIPYFREIILMSFECEHCGCKNSEVQFGGEVQEQGSRIEYEIRDKEDLNRQIIKSDTASVFFPTVEFEIPAKTQRGTISTIEGLLQKSIEHLRLDLDERRRIDPETTEKLDTFIQKLALMAAGITLPFSIIVDDPAGNSHIENPFAPKPDPEIKTTHYYRSEAQDLSCGLQPDLSHDTPAETPKVLPPRNKGLDKFIDDANIAKKEVIQFPVNCYACNVPGYTCMCMTDVPHFKEVIIMAFNCEKCGFRTNEVKGGGAIPPLGERIVLRVDVTQDSESLSRDVLKSDSACVSIPEIELEMTHGSLGGLYTTIEGLLDRIRKNIEEGNPFAVGDSDNGRSDLSRWLDRLEELKLGQKPFTLIVEDPLANSFVYSPYGSADKDPFMTASKYQRTDMENEMLGLADMNTDTYGQGMSEGGNEGLCRKGMDKEIRSDKDSMQGGGMALDPAQYHPNPDAVMQLNSS